MSDLRVLELVLLNFFSYAAGRKKIHLGTPYV
jgi:hypothetical protein